MGTGRREVTRDANGVNRPDETGGLLDRVLSFAGYVDLTQPPAAQLDFLPMLDAVPLRPGTEVHTIDSPFFGDPRRLVVCIAAAPHGYMHYHVRRVDDDYPIDEEVKAALGRALFVDSDGFASVNFDRLPMVKKAAIGPIAAQRRDCLRAFLRLANGTEEEIRRFVQTYGVLDFPRHWLPPNDDGEDDDDIFVTGDYGEDLSKSEYIRDAIRRDNIDNPRFAWCTGVWHVEGVDGYRYFARCLIAALALLDDKAGGSLTGKQRREAWRLLLPFALMNYRPEDREIELLILRCLMHPRESTDSEEAYLTVLLSTQPEAAKIRANFIERTVNGIVQLAAIRIGFGFGPGGTPVVAPALDSQSDAWERVQWQRQSLWGEFVSRGEREDDAPADDWEGHGYMNEGYNRTKRPSPLLELLALQFMLAVSETLRARSRCHFCGGELMGSERKYCDGPECQRAALRERQRESRQRAREKAQRLAAGEK